MNSVYLYLHQFELFLIKADPFFNLDLLNIIYHD